MSKLTLFEAALSTTEQLFETYPQSTALCKIIEQLKYLIDLGNGAITDRSKLSHINIGVLAAREVEDMDGDVAQLLHQVSAEVRSMQISP
jgi:hypothetical protein